MKKTETTKQNRTALIILLIGLALACVLMCAPLYTFQASVYTKKSSNTFVGDEKYAQTLEEVEEVAQQYREQGFEAQINEAVTERTNSKGEKTSLITFTIDQSFHKTVWSFLGSDLPSGHVLRIMACCMVLAVLCTVFGSIGTMNTEYKFLPGRTRMLRSAAGLFLLADLILTPVFVLMNNYAFWRKTSLYYQDLITDGKEEWFAKMDDFLFGGRMGDNIEAALKNLPSTCWTLARPASW